MATQGKLSSSVRVVVNPSNISYTKTGLIDRRKKIYGSVDEAQLRRVIRQEISKVEVSQQDGTSQPAKVTTEEDGKKKVNGKKRNWKTSSQAVMISARVGYALIMDEFETTASTDYVKNQINTVKNMYSLATMAIGTAGGPVGAVIASAMALAQTIFGNYVTNSIQRSGDTKRTAHSFTVYDTQKYGTHCYDNNSNSWVSEDINKIKSRVLGQKTSV